MSPGPPAGDPPGSVTRRTRNGDSNQETLEFTESELGFRGKAFRFGDESFG